MNKLLKQFNLRDKKYALPLIFLPFMILFIALFTKEDKKSNLEERSAISVNLGGQDNIEIGDKTESYKKHRDLRGIDNQRIAVLEKEKLGKDSIYDIDRNEIIIDSMKNNLAELAIKSEQHRRKIEQDRENRGKGYVPPSGETGIALEETRRKERELADLLNKNNRNNDDDFEAEDKKNTDGVQALREQMRILDSLDRATNPERIAKDQEEEYQNAMAEQRDFLLNSTLSVTKANKSTAFNTTYKNEKSGFIKAIIDEDIKGYLGSRIRIRLLEDIYVGNALLPKGSFLYSTISGFDAQRVNLTIVSALIDNEILPINLEIYDLDGMQGLYVPRSLFREISQELATQQMQGQQLGSGGDDNFYQSMMSKAFTSTSGALTSLIKKHKAKVKYNSHLYLIDQQSLKKKRKAIYDQQKDQ